MTMQRKMFQLVAAVALLALAPTTTFAQALAIDKVLVVVNEEPIMLSEYQARHRREVLQQTRGVEPFDGNIDSRILNQMINDRILAQMALRSGIRIQRSELEDAIASIAVQVNSTPQQLIERLAADGIAPDQFIANIRERQLIRRLSDIVVNARVEVSEREVENYLANHEELGVSDEAYEVSHLFVPIGEKSEDEVQSAYDNLEDIRRGLIEAQSADSEGEGAIQEFSDSASGQRGRYLGWRNIDQLPQPFVKVLQQTQIGGVSEIIRGENGLHLLQLHDRKSGGNIVEQQYIRHILVRPESASGLSDAEEQAESLYARLVAGEDFAKIALAHSADMASRADSGRLGWINPGDFPPEFEQAVRALGINEVSKPLRIGNNYHLVEVLERRRRDISADLAVKRARQIIFQRKAAEFYDNWYRTIRDAAHIEYVSVTPSG